MGKSKDRMMTPDKILTMVSRITQMWEKSKGRCDCTVHKRTGDIAELCAGCSRDCALQEIFDYIEDQYKAER